MKRDDTRLFIAATFIFVILAACCQLFYLPYGQVKDEDIVLQGLIADAVVGPVYAHEATTGTYFFCFMALSSLVFAIDELRKRRNDAKAAKGA